MMGHEGLNRVRMEGQGRGGNIGITNIKDILKSHVEIQYCRNSLKPFIHMYKRSSNKVSLSWGNNAPI